MSNTYAKIYLHIVFAVKGRESFLTPLMQQRLHLYFSSLLQTMGHYPVAIGGIDNHVHLLIDYKPSQPIPDMVRELKTASTKLINDNHMIPFRFAWQRGYACFSYSPSQLDAVKRYVNNQAEHHRKLAFVDEVKMMYEKFGVQYDERYIFTND